MIKIKIKRDFGFMPKKAYDNDAAYDLFCPEDILLEKGRQIIDLGFSMELPHGYAATIQPRSGFSAKGMEVYVVDGYRGGHARIDADVVRGLIDENYRGHIGVIVNVHDTCGNVSILEAKTRFAQMQIVSVPDTEFEEVDELSDSDRGGGGFESTGSK